MEKILSIILNNRDLIVSLIILVISIINLFVKKKVKVNDVLTGVYQVLPKLISEAEYEGLDGSKKFTLVFNGCIRHLMSITGSEYEQVVKKYGHLIDTAIEDILATPMKKGVLYEKKNVEQTSK